jgi:hypothetical protein
MRDIFDAVMNHAHCVCGHCVCGETNDARNVDSEYEGSGVSGVVGSVRYAFVGFVWY